MCCPQNLMSAALYVLIHESFCAFEEVLFSALTDI